MDIQVTNEKSQETLNNPDTLAIQAKIELQTTETTTVVCPKCGGVPTLTMTEKGERTIVTCPCRYVHEVLINF